MKTLVFSDTHLTKKFNPKKFEFLKKIIDQSDEVIINGDFWDGYLTSFDDFVKSDWQKLFPILKAKNTIYNYGNHDKTKWSDSRVNLFSVKQQKKYIRKFKDKELVIIHGGSIKKSIGERFHWASNKVLCYVGLNSRRLLTRLFGPFFIKIFPPAIRAHLKIKNWAKEKMRENQILIASHSHRAYFKPEEKYINTGFVNGSHAQYLIISDDKIELKRDRY